MNRPLLAACGANYGFVSHDDSERKSVPEKVLKDLRLVGRLLFALVVDLRAGWTPFVAATDGAEDFGYRGTEARCSPEVTRQLASHARSWPNAFFPSDVDRDVVESWSCGLPASADEGLQYHLQLGKQGRTQCLEA